MPPTQNQTSFIPRKPVSSSKKTRGGGVGIMFMGAFGIFLITAITAGAVYGYREYTSSRLDAQRQSLEAARGAFDPEIILELQRFSDRIKAAEEVVAGHVAFSQLFDILNESTLQTVQFIGLDLRPDEDGYLLILDGETQSYSSVVLQSEQFAKVKEFKNPIFSDILIQQNGTIGFTVEITIDAGAFPYEKTLTVN